jgi:hypothetical protein
LAPLFRRGTLGITGRVRSRLTPHALNYSKNHNISRTRGTTKASFTVKQRPTSTLEHETTSLQSTLDWLISHLHSLNFRDAALLVEQASQLQSPVAYTTTPNKLAVLHAGNQTALSQQTAAKPIVRSVVYHGHRRANHQTTW